MKRYGILISYHSEMAKQIISMNICISKSLAINFILYTFHIVYMSVVLFLEPASLSLQIEVGLVHTNATALLPCFCIGLLFLIKVIISRLKHIH